MQSPIKEVISGVCNFICFLQAGNNKRQEPQDGIKIPGRNINNLRYAVDTTLMAESKKEIESLFKVKKESDEAGLKLKTQKTKIMTPGPTASWQIDGETTGTVTDFIFLGSLNHFRW